MLTVFIFFFLFFFFWIWHSKCYFGHVPFKPRLISPWALSPTTFLTTFQSDHHAMSGVCFRHWSDCNPPHLSATDISRDQWTSAISNVSLKCLFLIKLDSLSLRAVFQLVSRRALIVTFWLAEAVGWLAARRPLLRFFSFLLEFQWVSFLFKFRVEGGGVLHRSIMRARLTRRLTFSLSLEWHMTTEAQCFRLPTTRALQSIRMRQSTCRAKNSKSGRHFFFINYSIVTERNTGGFRSKPSEQVKAHVQ